MTDAACAPWSKLHSAFVDGALADDQREKLLRHLSGCRKCRSEIDELRGVRNLLHEADPRLRTPPTDLSSRLVSIAGDDADQPLARRAFRGGSINGGRIGLPRRHRLIRVRLTAVAIALGGAVGAAGIIGYATAPTPKLPMISNPAGQTRPGFTSTLGWSPWSREVLGAITLADSHQLGKVTTASSLDPSRADGESLDSAQSMSAIRRAAASTGALSFDGTQRFTAVRDRPITAEAEIAARAGQGSQIRVVGASGHALIDYFSSAADESRAIDATLLELLNQNFTLSGRRDATVAGRRATVVTANHSGTVAARWWIDDATGLLLWWETYDASGAVEVSVGFTRVDFLGRDTGLTHGSTRFPVAAVELSARTLDRSGVLDQGWACPETIADLSLVRLQTDHPETPKTLQLAYSNGISTVTVSQQHGQLVAPDGAGWDSAIGAYVWHGAIEGASWQAGDIVYTVLSDSSDALAQQAVRALPHDPAHHPSTMDQVKAGWAKILADVRG